MVSLVYPVCKIINIILFAAVVLHPLATAKFHMALYYVIAWGKGTSADLDDIDLIFILILLWGQ